MRITEICRNINLVGSFTKQCCHLASEFFSNTTIDDEVDRRVEDEEHVVDGHEDVEEGRHMEAELSVAFVEMFHGAQLR